MLLVKTELRSSGIHGLGVFAVDPIPKGELVWEFTPGLDHAFTLEVLTRLTPVQREQFLRHSYLDSNTKEYVYCADDGRFMNDSETPNTIEFYADANDRYGANVAARNIAAGEELTCDYFSFDEEAAKKLCGGAETPRADFQPTIDRETQYLHKAVVFVESNSPCGHGLEASTAISKGTLIAVWGGEVYNEADFLQLPPNRQRYAVQVEDSFHLVAHGEIVPADYFNHSCDPNTGIVGQVCLVSLRDIEAGEQVCYDYAMTEGSPHDEFDCLCGTDHCRGRITGEDWRRPELQTRYGSHFSPYLTRKIELSSTAESTTADS